jgi:hypothetical protein
MASERPPSSAKLIRSTSPVMKTSNAKSGYLHCNRRPKERAVLDRTQPSDFGDARQRRCEPRNKALLAKFPLYNSVRSMYCEPTFSKHIGQLIGHLRFAAVYPG